MWKEKGALVGSFYRNGAYVQSVMCLSELIYQARTMAHESRDSGQVNTEGLLATEYHAAAGVAITLGHSELVASRAAEAIKPS
ncbi:hypothetical protein [Nocardiopsis sp. NPDC006938]|uniref:hypothetical protein n=1 Tax=Nocardiopsis sp. NPDC006938 TaxID=3364337 RepID=UPI00368FE2A3